MAGGSSGGKRVREVLKTSSLRVAVMTPDLASILT